MSDSDYIGKMISAEIEKRTYIDNPMEVPEGASVQEGPQGGYYYEDYDGGGDGDGILGAVADAFESIVGMFTNRGGEPDMSAFETSADIPEAVNPPSRSQMMGHLNEREHDPNHSPATHRENGGVGGFDWSKEDTSDEIMGIVETLTEAFVASVKENNDDLSESDLKNISFAVRQAALSQLK